MVSTAFKPSQEIYSLTPNPLPAHPTLGNFSQVIDGQASGIGTVWLFFRNSLAVTLAAVLISSLVSLLASVGVARFRFRFRTSFLIMLLIVQMIPGQALIIGLFREFDQLNLLQNLLGLVIVYAAQALPVSIWILRNFVATVPRELDEAAAIDGAGRWATFRRIMLPLLSPASLFLLVWLTINALQLFDEVYLSTSGGPLNSTTVLVYYLYEQAFGGANFNFGYASAIAYFLFVIILVVTAIQFRVGRRLVHYRS